MQQSDSTESHYDTEPRNGIMSVSPGLAKAWLQRRNHGNRTLSASIVKQYAEAMRQNRWLLTHQGIAFDKDGRLIDGQHRLKAVADSGKTIKIMVTVGLERLTFSVMDTGRRRQANQLLDMPHSTTIAAAARILSYLVKAVPEDMKVHGRVVPDKVENDVLLRVVDDWPELLAWASRVAASYSGARITPSAHLAVVAQAARGPHVDLLKPWFEGITSGARLDANDPRLVLRNRFMQGTDIKGGGSTKIARAYLLVVKAWNAYASGTPIRILKVTPNQEPPSVM